MSTDVARFPTHDAEGIKALLDARARTLAKPIAEERDTSDDSDVVVFTLGPERYAIDCRFVRAISKAAGLTPIPGTPAFVMGAVRIRGEIHAVFNLATLINGQRHPLTPGAKVVALGEQRIEFCLVADDVTEIAIVQMSKIHARTANPGDAEHSFLRGMTSDAIQIIDGAALLQHQHLYVGKTDHLSIAKGGLT